MTTTVLVWLLRCATPTLEQEVFLTPVACYDQLASYARHCETPTPQEPTWRDRCLDWLGHCACVRRVSQVLEPPPLGMTPAP